MNTSKKPLVRMTFIASVILTCAALWGTFSYVHMLAENQMDIEISKVKQSFYTSVQGAAAVSENFKVLLEAIGDSSEETFQKLSTIIFQKYPYVRNAVYYKKVFQSQRSVFEDQIKKRKKDAKVLETCTTNSSGVEPAKNRPEYLSLWLADEPYSKDAYYGWDLLSDPTKVRGAREAMDTQQTRASDGYLLDDGRAAVDVFVPILDKTSKDILGLVSMTTDLTALLGDKEWRKNVTVRLSTALSGDTHFKQLYRSLDQIESRGPVLSTLRTSMSAESFGQKLKLDFERELDFFKINTGILLMVLVGCILLGGVSLWLAETLTNLADTNAGLERMVAQRTRDLQNVLDNLEQGFFTFNSQGKLGNIVSRGSIDFFGTKLENRDLADVLQLKGLEAESIQTWLEVLYSNEHEMRFSDLVGLGPKTFIDAAKRFIEIRYFPIYTNLKDQKLESVISVATNKTAEKALEAQVKKEQSQVKFVINLLSDRAAFKDYVEEARAIFNSLNQELSDPKSASLDSIFRGLHTLKGGSAAYHVLEVTELAHQLESQILMIRESTGSEKETKLAALLEGVIQLTSTFEDFLKKHVEITGPMEEGSSQTRSFETPLLETWVQKLSKTNQKGLSESFCEDFLLDDFSKAFKRFEPVIQRIAEQQGKFVEFHLPEVGPKVMLKAYRGLLSSFIHVFRNSVDHGIEDPETRESLGKTPTGTIRVQFKIDSSKIDAKRLQIEASDDGKGINPAIIRRKAEEKDLKTKAELEKMSDLEVIQIIFENGFSTRDTVSDLSGRGVGMDALRFEAIALGGTAEVRSEVSKGSVFRVEVPWIKG